jgi:hypothetical protein
MNSNEYFGIQTIFWTGVVEDRNDPIKLGRVRVRVYSWYSSDKEKVPTNSLPWAQVIQQPTSAAMGDIGYSPTGIVEGTWVFGIFLDGQRAQQPIVLGTLSGIPTSAVDATKGFNDPNGVYPSRIDEPDVNRLARNDPLMPHGNDTSKNSGRSTGVSTSTGNTWDEPASAYAAQYPYNHVYQSESGHIREYDDTTNNERIHEYHKAGTFYEIDSNGNKVTRIVGNNYVIVAGNDYAYVKGAVNLTIDGDCNTYIKGDWNIKVDGDVNETIGGDQTTTASGNIDINATRIDLN